MKRQSAICPDTAGMSPAAAHRAKFVPDCGSLGPALARWGSAILLGLAVIAPAGPAHPDEIDSDTLFLLFRPKEEPGLGSSARGTATSPQQAPSGDLFGGDNCDPTPAPPAKVGV